MIPDFVLKVQYYPNMPTLTKIKTVYSKDVVQVTKDMALKPYWGDQAHRIILYQEDCLKVLSQLPDNSVDMIFADPPYFLSNGGITCQAGKMVSVNKGDWDKSKGVEENHEFNRKWLAACQRVLAPNGTIWVSGTAHVIHSVGYAMQQLGFKLLNDIVWFKVNPPPNLSCRYFTHSTETIIWAAKNKDSKHTFNYEPMKAVSGKQMKNVWQDLIDDSIEELKRNLILSITPPKPEEKLHGKHPTQKPVKLLSRIIQSSTKPDDIVLDPFNGSGTTGVAAYREGRQYIGIELGKNFLDVSIKRLKDEFETFHYAKEKGKS
jgi:site-specific DNA-methyltransferase (adenine-specific)